MRLRKEKDELTQKNEKIEPTKKIKENNKTQEFINMERKIIEIIRKNDLNLIDRERPRDIRIINVKILTNDLIKLFKELK